MSMKTQKRVFSLLFALVLCLSLLPGAALAADMHHSVNDQASWTAAFDAANADPDNLHVITLTEDFTVTSTPELTGKVQILGGGIP